MTAPSSPRAQRPGVSHDIFVTFGRPAATSGSEGQARRSLLVASSGGRSGQFPAMSRPPLTGGPTYGGGAAGGQDVRVCPLFPARLSRSFAPTQVVTPARVPLSIAATNSSTSRPVPQGGVRNGGYGAACAITERR